MADTVITLKISADGSAAITGVRNVETAVKSMGDAVDKSATKADASMEKLGARIGLVVAGAVTALGALVVKSINAADAAGTLAARLGTTSEFISTIGYAARQNGANVGDMSSAISTLSANAARAQAGVAGYGTAFKSMGINVNDTNGKIKSADVLLLEVSKKFSGYAEGPAKVALANRLMGESGAAVIPAMNAMGKGFDDISDSAQRAGQVISSDAAEAAAHAKRKFEDFKDTATGFANQLTAAVLPTVIGIGHAFLDAGDEADKSGSKFDGLNEVLKFVATVLSDVIEYAQKFGATIGYLGDQAEMPLLKVKAGFAGVKALMSGQDVKSAVEPFLGEYKRLTAGAQGAASAYDATIADIEKNSTARLAKIAGSVSGAADATGKLANQANLAQAPTEGLARSLGRAADDGSKFADELERAHGKLAAMSEPEGAYARALAEENSAIQFGQRLISDASAERAKGVISQAQYNDAVNTGNAIQAQARTNYAATTAKIKEQVASINGLLTRVKDQQALIGLSDHERMVAQEVQQATKYFNDHREAVERDGDTLESFQAKAKAAGEELAMAFDLTNIFSELDNADPFKKLDDQIKTVTKSLADAKAGIGAMANPEGIAKLQDALDKLHTSVAVGVLGATASALKGIQSLTKEGSKEYALMEVAVDALGIAQAITAVLNQGNGDPYSAWARMAAMAAAVAPLVAQLGGTISSIGGGGFTDVAKQRQDTQGTGTVLGDATKQSESIAKAMDITADATSKLVGINRGMLTALQSLQAALGSAGNMLAHGAGDAKFPSIGATQNGFNQFLSSFDPLGGDPLTKAVSTFLFGGNKKIVDQGIDIIGGSIDQILHGVIIGAYQTVQTSGGLFGSTKTKDNVVGVSDDFNKQMQLVFGSLVDSVQAAAKALGIPLADIQAKIDAFHVAEQKISLKGLSADDQQKAIEAVFSSIFDGLAGSVVPFIGQFQKVGEGLGETLVRVATEVQVFQQAVKYLGLTVNETDPEKFAQISDGLIGMFGSLDDFIGQMQSFTANFAPEAFKFKTDTEALTSAFGEVGLTLPTTREGMFALMQSLDATTASGQAQIATLLRLSDTANSYYDALDKRAKAAADYANEMASINVSTGHVSPIMDQLRQIRQWSVDMAAKLNALAQSAGRAGASELDLARVQEEAARRAAEAIATLKQSTLDLAAKLGYVDTLDTLNSKIAALQSSAGSAASGIGHAAGAISGAADKLNLEIGDLSPYSDQKKLDLALQGLRAGTVSADQVLQIGRRLYSSGDDYNKLFQQVLAINPAGAGGAGDSTTAIKNNSAALSELIAQRDKMQAAQDKQNAQQLAQNIADLAQAQHESVQDVAKDLGLNLDDLAKTLGIGNDKIADFIAGLEKEDIAGTFVDQSGNIVDAINTTSQAIVDAIYSIGRATLPNSGTGITTAPGSAFVAPIVTPAPPVGGGGRAPGIGQGQGQQNAQVLALLDRIGNGIDKVNDATDKTHRMLADDRRERAAARVRA